jgi:hypothetical protein
MLKSWLLVLLFIFTTHNQLFAQKTSVVSNLYQYGEPVLSCEDNLKNFIGNFHRYVDNAKEFHLMDYEYTGIIKNQKQALRFIKRNFETPAFNAFSSYGDDFSTIRLGLSKNGTIDKKDLQKRADAYANGLVKTGYHIYAIKFLFELKSYIYYVFINPENKQIICEVSPFGFDIPVKHFVFHDNMPEH